MITAGIDIGSLTAKAVLFKDSKILSSSLILTGPDSPKTAKKAMDKALENGTDLSLHDLDYVVSTGYGRVIVPFAQKNITEISCHAKGAQWLFPQVRTILDMGGQDCKAIRCNETGKVTNFVMNDKCAAGTGRFFDIIAEAMGLALEDIGALSLQMEKAEPISNYCAVFAKSEVVSLLLEGKPKNDILAGVCEAVSARVSPLIKTVGAEPEFAITGGIAKNIGVVKRLEEKIGLKANIASEPQIIGALGAALFAGEILEKQQAG